MPTTRYYLPASGSAPVEPAFGSEWDGIAPGHRTALATAPTGTALASRSSLESLAAPGHTLSSQWVGPPLAEGGTLAGSFVLMLRAWESSTSADARLAARLAVVSGDGTTVRGVLFFGDTGTELPTAAASRSLTGDLSPVVAVAGDRLVVEVGFYFANVAASGVGASIRVGDPAATADYTATGDTADLRPWLDLTLADPPPDPPTGLAADPSTTTVALSWTAPASGPAPVGYTVTVDAGLPIDVGAVTAWTVEGLAPSTPYTFEVRAYNAAGDSAPAAVAVSTDPLHPGYYRTVVELGPHTWSVEAGDPPTFGPVLPLSFGWSVPEQSAGFPANPDPATASVSVLVAAAADLAGVDIGSRVVVRVYRTPGAADRPFAAFAGRVADLEASPHPQGLLFRVLATDYTTDLAGRLVGGADWPGESGDSRVGRIVAEADVPGWAADAVGNTFGARDGSATAARAVLTETLDAAAAFGFTRYDAPGRVLLHHNITATGDLDTAAPFGGRMALRQTTALDVVDGCSVHRDLTWRRTKLMDATRVDVDHPGGPTSYGDPFGVTYPPVRVDVTDPAALADMILDTTPGFRWLVDTMRLDLAAPAADGTTAADWFWRDPDSPPHPWAGRCVVVENIAGGPDGSSRYAGMLSAARLVIAPGGHLFVDFGLRPEVPAHSVVTIRWMDEDPAATWADEPPTATWFELRTIKRTGI